MTLTPFITTESFLIPSLGLLLKMMLLLAFLAEGAEYGGENLIREESLEAESQEERTADTAGGKLNSQPEEEEQTSSTEQSSWDPEVEHAHMLNYMYTLSPHSFKGCKRRAFLSRNLKCPRLDSTALLLLLLANLAVVKVASC